MAVAGFCTFGRISDNCSFVPEQSQAFILLVAFQAGAGMLHGQRGVLYFWSRSGSAQARHVAGAKFCTFGCVSDSCRLVPEHLLEADRPTNNNIHKTNIFPRRRVSNSGVNSERGRLRQAQEQSYAAWS